MTVSGSKLSAACETSGLNANVGYFHTFYLKDILQTVWNELELLKVYQKIFPSFTDEDQPCSKCEPTLHTHLKQTNFVGSFYGSMQFKVTQQAGSTNLCVKLGFESYPLFGGLH